MQELPNSGLTTRNALAWSFAQRYSGLLISLTSTVILARLLTPHQVGIFSLCAAFMAIAAILRDFGVTEYLIQEKDLNKDKLKAAVAMAFIIAWPAGLLIWFGRSAIAEFYDEQGVKEVLAVLSINFAVLPFATPAFALLTREMEFKKIYVINTISATIGATTSVTLAYMGHGYMSLAWGSAVGVISDLIIVSILRPKDSWVMPSVIGLRRVANYGGMFAAARVIDVASSNSHEFIIAKKMDFESVGLFSRAYGLFLMFYQNFTSAILRVALPVFARDHRNGSGLADAFSKSTAMVTVIAWPFYLFLSIMSEDIINLMFGDQWIASAAIASILAIAKLPGALTTMGPTILAATGHVKFRLKMTLIYAPIHVLSIYIASHWGLLAMAAAFGVTSVLATLHYAISLPRLIKCKMIELFIESKNSAYVAIACLMVQVGTKSVCEDLELNMFFSLVLVAVSTAITWLAAIRLFKHVIYTEMESMFAVLIVKLGKYKRS